MKIFVAMKAAAFRSIKSWKSLLIVWFSSLLLVSMIAIPMKGALNTGFGRSTITEKLADGFDIQVFADLGDTFKSLASYFSAGFLVIILVGFILNAFFSGGLFNSIKGSSGKFSSREFFMSSAENFWPFLVISLIISLIVCVLTILVLIIPISMATQAEVPVEGAFFGTLKIVFPVFLLLLTIPLLVADYARAWLVGQEQKACFKAIGFGFRRTFTTFLSSYTLMIVIMLVQVLYYLFVLKIIPGLKPVSDIGVFLLFILSQILFLLKVFLKVWRYGSVTSLMETGRAIS
jgi:hypothetical protein